MKKKNIATSALMVTAAAGSAVCMTANEAFAAEVTESEVTTAQNDLNSAEAEDKAAQKAVDEAQSEYDAKVDEKTAVEKTAAEATPEKIAETEQSINDKTAEKEANDKLIEDAKAAEEKAKTDFDEKTAVADTAEKQKTAADEAVKNETTNVDNANDSVAAITDAENKTAIAENNTKEQLDKATADEKQKADELEIAKQNDKDLATAIAEQEKTVEDAKKNVDDIAASIEDKTKAAEDAKTALDTAKAKLTEIEDKIVTAPEIKFTNADAVKAYIEGYNFDWFMDINSAENRAYMDSESAKAARNDIIEAFKNAKYVPTEKDKTTVIDEWNLTDEQINELTLFGNLIINSMNKQFGYNMVKTADPLAIATKWMQNKYKERFVDGSETYTFDHIGIERDFSKQNADYTLTGETLCAGSPRTAVGGNFYGEQVAAGKYVMADFKRSIFESIKAYMTNGDELAHAQLTTNRDAEDGAVGVWTIVPGSRTNMKLTVVQFNYAKNKDNTAISGAYVDNKDKYADEIAAAGAEVDKQTAEYIKAANALEDANAALKDAKNALKAEQAKLDALKNGESPLAVAQKAYDTAKAALDEAQKTYDNAVANHKAATEDKAKAEQRLADAEQKLVEAKEVQKDATEKAETAAADLKTATDTYNAAQKDTAEKVKKSAELEQEIDALTKKLDIYKNAPQRLAELEDEIMILAGKLQKAKIAKLESADKLEEAAKKYNDLKAQYDKQVAENKAKTDAEAKVNAAIEKKNSNVPQTGDNSNIALATTAGILSIAGIFGLKRKQRNR